MSVGNCIEMFHFVSRLYTFQYFHSNPQNRVTSQIAYNPMPPLRFARIEARRNFKNFIVNSEKCNTSQRAITPRHTYVLRG